MASACPGLKAFQTRPGFQQRTVHRSARRWLTPFPALARPPATKTPCHVRFQQAVAILGEGGRVPLRRVQTDKPAEQQVVIHLFHQQALAADRIQHLQQLRPQQGETGSAAISLAPPKRPAAEECALRSSVHSMR